MYKLGIDLGGTNIAVGVVDESFNIVGKASVKTGLPCSAESIVEKIVTASLQAVENAKISFDEVSSIGLGSPGAVDPKKGIIEYASNLKFDHMEMGAALKKRFGKKVFIENDANAAAWADFLVSGVDKSATLIAVTLGTGVGGGIILKGKIFSGCNFFGGELGHFTIKHDGLECGCGRKGCWEAYASVTALIKQTKEKMEQCEDSLMWKICGGDIDYVDGRTAFQAKEKGDKAGGEVVEQYADYVAIGIVDIINIFQPDIISIAGGISREGDNLLEPVLRHVKENSPINTKTEIKISKLNNDAGIIGAANLDLRRL